MENQGSVNLTSTTDYDDMGDLAYDDDDDGEKSTERATEGPNQESNLSDNMEGDINTSTPSRDIYELDVLSIKSNEAITDYGPCMECDIPILTEDPPRSLVLNVCDHSDPLLPFQYSIVDYSGREKSSIPESERSSLVNLRNLGYNILKSLKDKTVRDIDFPELHRSKSEKSGINQSPIRHQSVIRKG
ncbi:hypothetical protein C1646_778188 [Rhizophagus diaphanus]|nr:hypothetical protein C1646_778188 [Rhizophagus diaphanus] [Rhizophagus sp. MUCL 43196]